MTSLTIVKANECTLHDVIHVSASYKSLDPLTAKMPQPEMPHIQSNTSTNEQVTIRLCTINDYGTKSSKAATRQFIKPYAHQYFRDKIKKYEQSCKDMQLFLDDVWPGIYSTQISLFPKLLATACYKISQFWNVGSTACIVNVATRGAILPVYFHYLLVTSDE